jgi:hypothetical protein
MGEGVWQNDTLRDTLIRFADRKQFSSPLTGPTSLGGGDPREGDSGLTLSVFQGPESSEVAALVH